MTNQPQDMPLPNKLFPFIWRYLRNRKLYLLGFFVVATVWSIEMCLSPYLLKVIIDATITNSQNQTAIIHAILIPAILYVSMSFVINITFRLYDYINLTIYPEIKAAASKDMFTYLLNHSYDFFQNNFSGNIAVKIFEMGSNIDQVISIFNEWFYPRAISVIMASVTLFVVVNPIFGIILCVWSAFFVSLSYYVAKKSEILSRIHSEAKAKMGGALSDSITNIISTKIFANADNEIILLDRNMSNVVATDRTVQLRNLKCNFILGLNVTLLVSAMMSALVYGSTQGWVSPGDFAFVLMLSLWFVASIYDIGQQMLKFSKVVGICNQSLSLIRIPHEIIDTPNAPTLKVTKGEIKFDNVLFKYKNNNPLFNTLNVTINPGEKVGLVGYSGGGKSTFIKLILRLMDTQSGDVLIDGQKIKDVTRDSLRKQIGTIPQDPDLFHRTIMENIRYARLDATDAEVIEAAKAAKCHEFITELPENYQSLVGERGIKLSGGQKQRIAIARAFLKKAPILLLDEATSSLDSVTERYIQESLHQVMMNTTTIVIAHRLSTLKDMDRILVFVKGQIVEDGSLDSLLENKDSHFYKLWQMQVEGFVP